MNKSRKNKKIKGSGNFLSRTRVEPAEAEEIMYFTIKWKDYDRYRIYSEYNPNNSYLTLNIGTSTDWIEYNNGTSEYDDVISIPTNNMIQLINLQIRDLDSNINSVIYNNVIRGIVTMTQDEIHVKREKYKYMAIKHYVTGMLDAEIAPVSLQVGRRINNSTVVPEPVAELIPQSVVENPNTLYWGGKKSRKRKIKKTKRSKKSKTKKNKL